MTSAIDHRFEIGDRVEVKKRNLTASGVVMAITIRMTRDGISISYDVNIGEETLSSDEKNLKFL